MCCTSPKPSAHNPPCSKRAKFTVTCSDQTVNGLICNSALPELSFLPRGKLSPSPADISPKAFSIITLINTSTPVPNIAETNQQVQNLWGIHWQMDGQTQWYVTKYEQVLPQCHFSLITHISTFSTKQMSCIMAKRSWNRTLVEPIRGNG